jgi:hypothetical protein
MQHPIVRLPDDATVWAFSDAHGMTAGLAAALREAGLVDDRLRWAAPAGTALVGCGDYVDRGVDVPGTVALLRRLTTEADAAGGRVVLARGNHEHMLLRLLDGAGAPDEAAEWLASWLAYGGLATLAGYGCRPPDPADPLPAFRALEAAAPGLAAWLRGLPHAVRWRDVLLVHGGLPPWTDPGDLGRTTDRHLWIRGEFFETPWESGAFVGYEQAGIHRVVFGHTPQLDGARAHHDGRSLAIDTNACGNPRLPPGTPRLITLVRLTPAGPLADAPRVVVATGTGPAAPGG